MCKPGPYTNFGTGPQVLSAGARGFLGHQLAPALAGSLSATPKPSSLRSLLADLDERSKVLDTTLKKRVMWPWVRSAGYWMNARLRAPELGVARTPQE